MDGGEVGGVESAKMMDGDVLADLFNIRTPWHRFVCVLAPRCPDTFEIG